MPTDPRWLAMTELEIMKETWRIHFFDLMREGADGNAQSETAVIEADDEEFEQWVKEIEDDHDNDNDDWEPVA